MQQTPKTRHQAGRMRLEEDVLEDFKIDDDEHTFV